MNNEPVAWIALNQVNNTYSAFTDSDKERMLPHVQQLYGNWIPLYTHPAKTLTDEEILREAYYILMREQQTKAQEQ